MGLCGSAATRILSLGEDVDGRTLPGHEEHVIRVNVRANERVGIHFVLDADRRRLRITKKVKGRVAKNWMEVREERRKRGRGVDVGGRLARTLSTLRLLSACRTILTPRDPSVLPPPFSLSSF